MSVFGTRPEAIKMAPLVQELMSRDTMESICCVTAQHREMLDSVMDVFGLTADCDLDIMTPRQTLSMITTKCLTGMDDAIERMKPDLILVHGDTSTTFAGALSAFYHQVPVGHVEAGLRTGNIYSPWPEEINRQMTARLATYNFAPTPLAENNLKAERVHGDIFVTGNTVIDALQQVAERLSKDKDLAEKQRRMLLEMGYDVSRLEGASDVLDDLAPGTFRGSRMEKSNRAMSNRRLVLVTGHRRENFGEGFIKMLTAMKDLAEKYHDVDFVYPMHLNPNVRRPIAQVFGTAAVAGGHISGKIGNFFFINPLDYLGFVYLMSKSYILLTDSGGIQEEAPGLGKPVLVMRDTTERPEALEAGTVRLVGTDYALIVNETSNLLDDRQVYEKMSKAINPYGDGTASVRIVQIITQCLLK